MKTKSGFRGRSIHECGVALVIVLALIVLLTGVIVAFFSRATSSRKLSDSSLNQNAAEQLGRSALDVITGDLRQEIAVGSTLTNSVYLPLSNINAVPIRSGVPGTNASGQDLIPNLIRRSVRSDSIQTPGVGSRASAVNATDISANSRLISLDRWNNHYLIPLSTTPTTPTSPTPVSDFVAPDWVYVTENGPTVLTTVPAASDPAVIGRYAYAIYDEGGLLDVNVAGVPSGLSTTQGGRKGSLAFADLKKVGLLQQDIDNLVGWRNYASSAAGGTFPSLTPVAASFYSYVVSNTTGFLTVNNLVASGKTDQAFTSRQALIAFRDAANFPKNALQYLGTFSRDWEQPSFLPNPNRPAVKSSTFANIASFGTGNSVYGTDRKTAGANDPTDINPPVPLVTYVRTGETDPAPAAYKRFPLSRLSKVTSTATASQSATDPIYSAFGLYRGSASNPWTYYHSTNSSDNGRILTLAEVAAQKRDPDFFELLKAAIAVGSLGKGAWYENAYLPGTGGTQYKKPHDGNPDTDASSSQLRRDADVDRQVLQIGANIIDQYDTDSNPTQITLAGVAASNNVARTVSGVEDLPYLYRIHARPVRLNVGSGAIYELLIEPDIWNPHAANGTTSGGPTNFRFGMDVDATVQPSQFFLRMTYSQTTSPYTPKVFQDTLCDTVGMQNKLTFNIGSSGFREPTLLAEAGHPAGSNLAGTTPYVEYATAGSGRSLVGIGMGAFLQLTGTGANTYKVTEVTIGDPASTSNNVPNTLMHFYLECQIGGNWIRYDQQDLDLFDFRNFISPTVSNQTEWQATPASDGRWMSAVRMDPRTSRWGMVNSDEQGSTIGPLSSANDYAHSTERPSPSSFGSRNGHIEDFAGPGGYQSTACARFVGGTEPYRGLLRGYFSENNLLGPAVAGAGGTSVYLQDADGVARRAIGGYAEDSASGGASNQTAGLPTITGNTTSRPIILNRPFRSVAELGYVFSDSVWKNLDFTFPESGNAALLDMFCMNEVAGSTPLVAGRVNLNTRQRPVLQALLSGAVQDEVASGGLSDTDATNIADALVKFTSSTDPKKGPLANRSELVGRFTGSGSVSADPSVNYSGFSTDLSPILAGSVNARIPRMREVAVRALADAGTTRVWNLMIDVVAQTGKFGPAVTDLKKFTVTGERRIWLHVAIDRLTGKIIDKQIEVVKE